MKTRESRKEQKWDFVETKERRGLALSPLWENWARSIGTPPCSAPTSRESRILATMWSLLFWGSDSENATGTPITFRFSMIDINTCAAVQNAAIDIWHCTPLGIYSEYETSDNAGGLGTTYLRGIQLTDSNGQANFSTIYPGWYSGLTTHVHVRVSLFMGRLYRRFTEISRYVSTVQFWTASRIMSEDTILSPDVFILTILWTLLFMQMLPTPAIALLIQSMLMTVQVDFYWFFYLIPFCITHLAQSWLQNSEILSVQSELSESSNPIQFSTNYVNGNDLTDGLVGSIVMYVDASSAETSDNNPSGNTGNTGSGNTGGLGTNGAPTGNGPNGLSGNNATTSSATTATGATSGANMRVFGWAEFAVVIALFCLIL